MTKKLTTNAAKKLIAAFEEDRVRKVVECDLGDEVITVSFTTVLSLTQKRQFINRVLGVCFDADGVFHEEYFTPIVRATYLQMCSDLPVLTIGKDEKGEKLLDLDAMNQMFLALSRHRLSAVVYDAYEGMYDQCETAVNERRRVQKLEVLRGIAGALSSVTELTDALTGLLHQAGSVDTEALTEYAGKLSEAAGHFSEDQLVQALNQIHKEEAASAAAEETELE